MAYQADAFENDAFQMEGATIARAIVRAGDFLPFLLAPGEALRQYLLVADDVPGVIVLTGDYRRSTTQIANYAESGVTAGDFGGGT